MCHKFLCTRFRSCLLSTCVRAYSAPLPPPFSVVVAVLFVTSMSGWSRPSSSSVSGDGFWKRALSALPAALADGLLTAELDDPTVLASNPRMDLEEAVLGLRGLSCTTADGMDPASRGSSLQETAGASSDAASQRNSTSTHGHGLPGRALEWCGTDVGGDPRTDHPSFICDRGDDPKTVQASLMCEMGDDPRTVHASFVREMGGDPKTDHEALVCETETGGGMAATCPPYRPGRLATETATSSASASPALLATVDHALPDGFPCPADLKLEANFEGSSLLDRILQRRFGIGILRDCRTAESSESLRQSQFERVQIVPATVIPSELSAHQMAARSDGLLIQSRADGRPTAFLSLQDKALLRKYSISGPSVGLNIPANARLVQNEHDGLMIRSEGSRKAEDNLRVDQADPTPADPLIPNLSSVSKDSELPTAGEADPKRRRRIGKAGIKKEARGDSEGASIDVFGSRSTNLSPADQKNVEFQLSLDSIPSHEIPLILLVKYFLSP